jgi:hypothetical protein
MRGGQRGGKNLGNLLDITLPTCRDTPIPSPDKESIRHEGKKERTVPLRVPRSPPVIWSMHGRKRDGVQETLVLTEISG